MELESRLNLYQIFQRLYAERPELLSDLLRLENAAAGETPLALAQHRYLLGVIEDQSVHIVTNVIDGQTQKLYQAQGIWTIGRGPNNALSLLDEHLSRHHAAIQYITTQGFFLHDLGSTNGTSINQEPVMAPIQLRDGDRIRIGSTVFSFFMCQGHQAAPQLTAALTDYFSQSQPTRLPETRDRSTTLLNPQRQDVQEQDTSIFVSGTSKQESSRSPRGSQFTFEEQARLLDHFFAQEEE